MIERIINCATLIEIIILLCTDFNNRYVIDHGLK